MRPIVAVYGASKVSPDGDAYAEGVRCGHLLAEVGFDVMTGGYGGIMEAVSRGASEAGARAFGVTVPNVFTSRSGANAYVTDEHATASLVSRIEALTTEAAAAITLPGSIGTFTELMVAWNLAYVARFGSGKTKPLVAVGTIWRDLIAHLSSVLDTGADLVTCVDDVDAAVAEVVLQLTADS